MTQKTLERTRVQTPALEYGAYTHEAGKRINEDAVHVMSVAGGTVALVADGISSGGLGDMMSREAITGAAGALQAASMADPEAALVQAFQTAHERVMEAKQRENASKSGTTLVGSWMIGGEDGHSAHIANIGDSRAYLLQRGRRLIQLTQDHSTPERLTYALGFPMDIGTIPGFYRCVRCEPGDTLLLCSDGLYRAVPEQAIVAVLTKEPPRRSAKRLVQLAIQNHTRDNASAIVLRIAAPTQRRSFSWLPILGVASALIAAIALAASLVIGAPFMRPPEQGSPQARTETLATSQQLAPGLIPTVTPNQGDGTNMSAPTITREATNEPTSTSTPTPTPTYTPTNTRPPATRPPTRLATTSAPATTSVEPTAPTAPTVPTAPVETPTVAATPTPPNGGEPTATATQESTPSNSGEPTEAPPPSATSEIQLGPILTPTP